MSRSAWWIERYEAARERGLDEAAAVREASVSEAEAAVRPNENDIRELGRIASGVPGANVCTPQGEREGPGSAAAPKFMPSAIGPFGFRSKDTDVTEELCIHRVRRNIVDGGPEHEYDSIGLTVADIHAKDARIKRLEADKAELVAALEMFNGPITHATFERARMTLAKHGGA